MGQFAARFPLSYGMGDKLLRVNWEPCRDNGFQRVLFPPPFLNLPLPPVVPGNISELTLCALMCSQECVVERVGASGLKVCNLT